jgi:ribonucleoside-diphosphate reductase alpha chain
MVASSQIVSGNGVNGIHSVTPSATKKLEFGRCFTKNGEHVGALFKWKKVDAVLKNAKGEETFRQDGVEAPEQWSDRAIKIVAEKYLRVVDGVKETSVMQLAHRVAKFITEAGRAQHLLDADASIVFYDELLFLILDQRFAFNSPVWFNVGVNPDEKPQSSACFIQSVQDTMESIMDLEKKEVMLFKQGSGTGGNLSPLRSSYEKLRGGGFASGPVSYMKPLDKNAGVTKSGGTTRRAAKMVVMNMDHPDILECRDGTPGFIRCKSFAEKVAHDLYSTGFYSAEFNVPNNVYDLVDFQNANNSVRCSDEFMNAVVRDDKWDTKLVTTGKPFHTYKARELWNEVAEAAWFCGDPGVQFDDTTNKWHTVPNSGRINASNPCSEYLHLDDSACNLGSWNLLKFWSPGAGFDVLGFQCANQVAITAMEILVDASSYPGEQIAKNAHDFRPLGIGYANLGALLMHMGLGYDSDDGRAMTSAITSLMSGECYAQSALIAKHVGAFNGYALNEEPMTAVIYMHYQASQVISYAIGSRALGVLITAANDAWHRASSLGKEHGFRNAQISVIAPTGTISFMMDCETTGCEPMLDIIVYKKLVGGGLMKMPNNAVKPALEALGYSNDEVTALLTAVESTGELVGLQDQHKHVFQTAIGFDQVSAQGHLLMMGAIQPFISGGISKTVNMPASTTAEQIADVYLQAWALGLKCVAVFRDGCKLSQPAASKVTEKGKGTVEAAPSPGYLGLKWGERKRLPDERPGITHKATVGGQDAYFHVGLYDDGKPGEVFIDIAKAGSTLHGVMDMASMLLSVGLQHGVPLEVFVDKLKDLKFEPDGITRNRKIPFASSIPDYLGKWMEKRFIEPQDEPTVPDHPPVPSSVEPKKPTSTDRSGPPCKSCGGLTIRGGSCWLCTNCGTTSGCG